MYKKNNAAMIVRNFGLYDEITIGQWEFPYNRTASVSMGRFASQIAELPLSGFAIIYVNFAVTESPRLLWVRLRSELTHSVSLLLH
jgi:hypothetical protein